MHFDEQLVCASTKNDKFLLYDITMITKTDKKLQKG